MTTIRIDASFLSRRGACDEQYTRFCELFSQGGGVLSAAEMIRVAGEFDRMFPMYNSHGTTYSAYQRVHRDLEFHAHVEALARRLFPESYALGAP